MPQYFIEDRSLDGNEKTFTLSIGGETLVFTSNAGQFSYGEADPNSLLLIKSLDIKKGDKLLDLGCGWGLIGIAAAKLFCADVTFCDINGIALEYAQKNADSNGVSGVFIKSDGFDKIDGKFDIITLNPPIHAGKETVLRLFSGSAGHIKKGGLFITVINEKHGANSYKKRLEELFSDVFTEKHKKTFIFKCYGAKNAD
ncbi:MAG: methyltransferase [Ruminococcus sp.]|jgi:16S rRNA (guanine1207-N2)-methyltransferase|nr:methyltransferase [Ruminococcus sp.]